MQTKIKALLIDFGGVIADEGFHDGLKAIAAKQGRSPDGLYAAVERIIAETGYLIGEANESVFWDAVRAETGIRGSNEELRNEILRRFVIRPEMLAHVDRIRADGITAAMVSDQTNWLEEIDEASGLFSHFDRIFNSYRIHKSKRDATIFIDVCDALGITPNEALFVDDNIHHIERARTQGLFTIHFTSVEEFSRLIAEASS